MTSPLNKSSESKKLRPNAMKSSPSFSSNQKLFEDLRRASLNYVGWNTHPSRSRQRARSFREASFCMKCEKRFLPLSPKMGCEYCLKAFCGRCVPYVVKDKRACYECHIVGLMHMRGIQKAQRCRPDALLGNNHPAAVSLLISCGADVNYHSPGEKDSPLTYACRNAPLKVCVPLVKSLLAHHADIHHRNARGYNALAISVEKYRVDVIIELLYWGASIKDANSVLKENVVHVALYRAEQTGNCRLLTELVAYGAIDSASLTGQSALVEAAVAVGKERFQARMLTIREKLLDYLPCVLSDICIAYLSILYAPLDPVDSNTKHRSSSNSNSEIKARQRALSDPETSSPTSLVLIPGKKRTLTPPGSVHRSFTFSPTHSSNTDSSNLFPHFSMLDDDGKPIVGLDEEEEDDDDETTGRNREQKEKEREERKEPEKALSSTLDSSSAVEALVVTTTTFSKTTTQTFILTTGETEQTGVF